MARISVYSSSTIELKSLITTITERVYVYSIYFREKRKIRDTPSACITFFMVSLIFYQVVDCGFSTAKNCVTN